jgi:flagellar protein FlaI
VADSKSLDRRQQKEAQKAANELNRKNREDTREAKAALKATRQQEKIQARMDAQEAKRQQREVTALTERADKAKKFEEDLAKHHEFVTSLAPKMGFDPKRPIVEIPPVPPGHEEISKQSFKDGLAHVRILLNTESNQMLYEVIEPQLSAIEMRAMDFLRDTLIRTMAGRRSIDSTPAEYLDKVLLEAIRDHSVIIDATGTERLRYHLRRDLLGFGPIDILMLDTQLEDISCDGPDIPIYIFHREHESLKTNVKFPDDLTLDGYVIRLAQQSGKHVSIADPLLDATLPDGSRLQATLSKEVTTRGSSFTVRRFRAEPLTPIHLMEYGTFTGALAAYFWLVMEHGMSILLAGGTASGKTTTLNAFCQFIPPQKKVVSIEDTREINLMHENWIAGITRSGFGSSSDRGGVAGNIDMYALLGAALRQRPEYLLVGEVRGPEALTLFQAMATGHAVYSTMHADSVASAVYRLENEPINVPRLMLQTLDVVAIQTQVRMRDQMVRRLAEITEVVGFDNETGDLLTNKVFEWNPSTDNLDYMGKSYILDRIAESQNRSEQDVVREWEDRMRILEYLKRAGINKYDKVTEIFGRYYHNPEAVMTLVKLDEQKTGVHPTLHADTNRKPNNEPERVAPKPGADDLVAEKRLKQE